MAFQLADDLGLDRRVENLGHRGEAFNLEHGAAFGLSHDFSQVACFRTRNQDATFPNLLFVGASTKPGTGLPWCCAAHSSARRISGAPCAPRNRCAWAGR